MNSSVERLSKCDTTKKNYNDTTVILCYDAASSQIFLTSIWQLLTGLTFIYLMITFYTWNRISLKKDLEYDILDDDDVEMKNRKKNTKTVDISNMRKLNIGCDMSIGCFSFLIVNLIIVSAMIFSVVFVIIFASKDVVVDR